MQEPDHGMMRLCETRAHLAGTPGRGGHDAIDKRGRDRGSPVSAVAVDEDDLAAATAHRLQAVERALDACCFVERGDDDR